MFYFAKSEDIIMNIFLYLNIKLWILNNIIHVIPQEY